MAKNPFKIKDISSEPDQLPSDKEVRFRKLASILKRRPQPSQSLQPSPIMPKQTQKLPKF